MATPRAHEGLLAVEVECPQCGRLELIITELSTVYSRGTGEYAQLKLRSKSKAITHGCGPDPADLFTVDADGVVSE